MNKADFCNKFIQNILVITFMIINSIIPSLSIANDNLPKAPSQLKFGARIDAAPMSYKEGENWKGYSIDLCRLIFKKYQDDYANHPEIQISDTDQIQRTQLEFIPVNAPERMDFLQKSRIDILCGATTVTVARMRYVDFTLLTFVSGVSLMKKKKTDSSSIFSANDNKGEAVKITYVGCTEGMEYIDCTTTDDWIANRFGSAIKPIPKQSHTEAFETLNNGGAHFYAGDRVILENKLRNLSNGNEFEIAPTFLTYEPYAIAIARGNYLLLHSANSTLAKLYRNAKNDGGINEIYFNHFINQQSEMLKKMYQLQAFPE